MKKLKRIFSLILAGTLALAMLTACGGSSGSSAGNQSEFITLVNENLKDVGITVVEDKEASAALKKYIDINNEYWQFLGVESLEEADSLTYADVEELEANVEDKDKQAEINARGQAAYDELDALDGYLNEDAIEGTTAEQAEKFANMIKSDSDFKVLGWKKVIIGYYQFTFGKDYVMYYLTGLSA